MKTVFTSDELPHLWANKSVPYGRTPSALSFNGDAISSYSTEIARHITHKGKAGIIFNESSYSVTTSKHQGQIRSAIPSSVPVFWIADHGQRSLADITGGQLLAYAKAQSAKSLQKAAKARTNAAQYESDAVQWLERANFVAEFFGLKSRVSLEDIQALRERSEAARLKLDAQRRAQEQKDQAKQRAAFEAWKAGQSISGESFQPRLFPVAFRVEDDELVSTLGARVSLSEARLALRFVQSKREAGWQRNGEIQRVGPYQIDAVNASGVVAGCHRITWNEIERVQALILT